MKLENCFIGQIVRGNLSLATDRYGKTGYISGLSQNGVGEPILTIIFSDGKICNLHPDNIDPIKGRK